MDKIEKVGMVGMGKLGIPVSLAIESKGYEVHGSDVNPDVQKYLDERKIPYEERGLQPLLDGTEVTLIDNGQIVEESDLVFVAVQTPHDPEYEGVTRLPDKRVDFDYRRLVDVVAELSKTAAELDKETIIAVISTCLPGTYEREIKPLLNDYVDFIYAPQFIAMGNVVEDYLHPEFNLIGHDHRPDTAERMVEFYGTINDAPPMVTDVTTAEAIKVSYNTFITSKIVLANLWGEIAHKTGANVDDIFKAWSLSEKRLLSDKYLRAGLGDGGGCHPRDNIALSHLAREIDLSNDFFETLMLARESHLEWLGSIAEGYGGRIVILGKSFKPETNIETGSPSRLIHNIMSETGNPEIYEDMDFDEPCTVIIGTQHERYKDIKFPPGSVVIDPHGIIQDQDGVKVIRIGRK